MRCRDVPDRCAGSLSLAHKVDVVRRVDELELFVGGAAGRQEVAVLDEARGPDQVHGQLHADRLQRVLIREVVFHQLVAIDESNRPRHCHLR